MAGKKGRSGPKHLPKDLKLECRTYTAEIIARMVDFMRQDDDLTVAFKAAQFLAERGWGKPEQSITGPNGGPVMVQAMPDLSGFSDEVLDALESAVKLRNSAPAGLIGDAKVQ